MRRALALLIEQGKAATPPSCTTTSRSPAGSTRGRPARSPTSSRGSTSASGAASPPGGAARRRLARPPRRARPPEEALAGRPARCAAEASGDTCMFIGARARAAPPRARRARGRARHRRLARRAARAHATPDGSSRRSRPPPPPCSPRRHRQARALLAELEQIPGARDTPTTPDSFRPCCAPRSPSANPSSPSGSSTVSSRAPAPRARSLRRPRPARRARRRPRPGRNALRRGGRALAASSETSPSAPTPSSARAAACRARPAGGRQPLAKRASCLRMGYRPALAETEALLGQTDAASAS